MNTSVGTSSAHPGQCFVFPCSYAQERLWFLEQWAPSSAVYNMPAAMRVRGAFEPHLFESSLNEVVRRHESLRTCFETSDVGPVQVILRELKLHVDVEDLSGLAEAQRATEIRRRAESEASRPFDLSAVPLMRAHVLRFADDDHVLFFTSHHIVSDAWSIGVLVREISAIYSALARGVSPSLSQLPIQYADYAVWQREWLRGENLSRELEYWKEELEGVPPILSLPADRPRPAVSKHIGGAEEFSISEEVVADLRALGRQQGATLYMTLLAGFQALLYRYTGQTDFVVGSPIAGRSRPELEGLIGFLVNTIAIRARIEGGMRLNTLLERTRETTLRAYSHQDLPFDRLVQHLQPERDPRYQPIFQVWFAIQNAPSVKPCVDGLHVELLSVSRSTVHFDLSLEFAETREGLRGSLQYSSDLFRAETIRRMASHFNQLLEGMSQKPEACICDLPLLGTREIHEVTVDWNRTTTDWNSEECVTEMFARQANATPQAVALDFAETEMTYEELDRRSNRLARWLRKAGVGPENRVGLCLQRSPEMMVGILGVLKTGGAYLPLDPESPPNRLVYMIEEAGTAVLLTLERHRVYLPNVSCPVICLDPEPV